MRLRTPLLPSLLWPGDLAHFQKGFVHAKQTLRSIDDSEMVLVECILPLLQLQQF